MSFGILALLVGCGLVGPLLASLPRLSPPVVVGEIAAGVVVGDAGLRWIDPTNPTLAFIADVGFVLLMFLVGTHLPLRDPNLRQAFGRGAAACGVTLVVAVPVALGLARGTELHETRIFLVLLTTSSAAVALPILREGSPTAAPVALIAWILLADVATIISLPLLLAEGSALRVVEGAALVSVTAVLMFLLARCLRGHRLTRDARRRSREHGWALDLRVALVALFTLAWIATRFSTSVLIAGFVAGAIVAAVGEPRRLAAQTFGVAEGFLVPIFFVVLGARLDMRALAQSRGTLVLAVLLTGAILVVHLASSFVVRLGAASGLVAASQLGVPSAVVALGLAQHLLTAAEGAAIVVAAMLSLLACAVGSSLLARSAG